MNSRIQSLRNRFIVERPSVDITRARIVTATHRQHLGEPLVSVWGKTMHRLLTELPIDIAPGELIVGSPTLKPRAAQLFPEVQAGWLDAELDTVATRAWDPLDISDEDKDELRRDILPFWQGRTIAERLFAQCPEDTAHLIYLEPGVWPTRSTGLIDNYSLIQKGIGTVVPNYRKVLELGVRGILKQIDEQAAAMDMTDTGNVPKALFYEAARMSLQGLVELAQPVDHPGRGLLGEQREPGQLAVEEDQREHEQVDRAGARPRRVALGQRHGDEKPAETLDRDQRVGGHHEEREGGEP